MSETIVLKGRGIRKERVADGEIIPGQLLYHIPSGFNEIGVHDSTIGVQTMFAVENEVKGDGIDVAYDSFGDSIIFYEILPPGAEVLAFLDHGTPAVVAGDFLESNRGGGLRKVATPPSVLTVGIALEAVDNLAGSEPVRIKIEVV